MKDFDDQAGGSKTAFSTIMSRGTFGQFSNSFIACQMSCGGGN